MASEREISFRFFPNLKYDTRIRKMAVLLGVGALLQLFLEWWWLGAPFIVVAGSMLVPKGINNRPEFGRESQAQWERVTDLEMGLCLEKVRDSEEWAKKGNLGCGAKSLLLLAFLGGCFLMVPLFVLEGLELTFLTNSELYRSHLRLAVGFDAAVLSLCLLLGRVKAWVPSRMELHLSAIMNVLEYVKQRPNPSMVLEPMLEIMDTPRGKVPRDARLMIKFKNAPDAFLGVQVQVSTNVVQGTSYPYLYCCILARTPLALFDYVHPHLGAPPRPRSAQDRKNKDKRLPTYEGCVVEMDSDGDVDVVVVRQISFGTGYKTGPAQQVQVVASALQMTGLCLAAIQHSRVRIRPPALPQEK